MNSRLLVHALAALTFLCWLSPLALPQSAQARVSARLSAGVVKLGSTARISIVVENAEGAELGTLPAVTGLEIGPVGPPSTTRRQSYVQGRVSSSFELVWNVPVRPLSVGEYTIPPIDVRVGGSTVATPELALTVVSDLRGEELGYFEITTSLSRAVEGQPFSVELRYGWDMGLASTVNYANLSLPWWDELPGTVPADPSATATGREQVQMTLNTSRRIIVEELAPQTVRGRAFRTFRAVRWFVPTRAGTLEFPTSFLEFAQEGESRGRNRAESHFVRAESFTIEVVSLPEQGRPIAFSGAIGSLEARADAQPRDVVAGESIQLAVEWTGNGNLEFFRPPDPARLEGFEGFRVYGQREEVKSFGRRKVVYDLTPLRPDVTEIPALPLSVYDPVAERYTSVATRPIPIRVRAIEGAGQLSAPPERATTRDIRDLRTQALATTPLPRPGAGTVAVALALLPLAWLGLRTSVRLRGRPDAPLERRRRRARRELARTLRTAQDAKAMLDALETWIAARLRAAPQAWIGRDPAELAAAGVLDEASAAELAALRAELESAAYGGRPLALDRERLLEVAARMEARGL